MSPTARLAFSFSGCGLTGGYHIGAWECLLRNAPRSMVDEHATPLIGTSGGAIVAAVLAAGVSPTDAVGGFYRIAAAVRAASEQGQRYYR